MNKESIYWLIVLLTFIYVLFKNKNSSIKVLIILCFYSGLASYYGKGIENPYKVVVVLLSIYILLKNNALSGLNKRESYLLFAFIFFSISFLYSAIINEDYFTLVFSQYGKYVTPICLFFIFNRILIKSPDKFFNLKDLFFSILTIQILLSAVKIITHGLQESPVGSVAYIGGGPAAMLPVMGFILVWIEKRGNILRKDWRYILMLLFIGFTSIKRVIWFIMPVFILLFMYYVPGKLKVRHLKYILPVLPLVFYAGVRLSPTLNKEGKLGGTFDLKYVLEYVQKYNFGRSTETSDVKLGSGRGGASLLLFGKLFNNQPLSSNDYWGYGLQEVYTTDYEQFNDEKYGVNSKGAVTGVFQSYIASGFVGVLVTILLILSISSLVIEPRIRITISLLLFFDYLLYSGLILRSQSLFILLLFIIIYSNQQFRSKMPQILPIEKSNDYDYHQ